MSSVILELLDGPQVQGTVVEDTGIIELIVEEPTAVVALEIQEYLEFDDGRGPSGENGLPGSPGPPGPPGTEPEILDLVILFENGLT